MKTNFNLNSLIVSALVMTSSIAFADHRMAEYPVDQVLSVGLKKDNPNNIEMIANVMYPNGCFTPVVTTAMTNLQQRSITLRHITNVVDTDCTQAIVHQYPEVQIAKPESAIYRVWDAASSNYLGTLVVTDEGVIFERSQADKPTYKQGGNYL